MNVHNFTMPGCEMFILGLVIVAKPVSLNASIILFVDHGLGELCCLVSVLVVIVIAACHEYTFEHTERNT